MRYLPPVSIRLFSVLLFLFGVVVWLGGRLPPNVMARQMDAWGVMRRRMVETQVRGRGVRDARVLRAMQEVPRHLFVPRNQKEFAYQDAALPIGYGQTITSPYVVAFMTAQLNPRPTDRVLEIGTGSGYQAAVLSRLVAKVYSIEIVEPLGRRAARTIGQLGYDNVYTKIGDGYQGWPEHAPFDKIIVTCSPEHVPPALVNQLRDGGRLIVPLGERFQQTLYLFHKRDGDLEKEPLEATFFVPMTGEAERLRTRKEDSGRPEIVNGGFEEKLDSGEPEGWFYVTRAEVIPDPSAPEGDHVLALTNRVPGKKCHVVQAFGVDGQMLNELVLSVRVRTTRVNGGRRQDTLPRIEVSFYDESRRTIETVVMGPWKRQPLWARQTLKIPVPNQARLATVSIGMFGATGQFMVDQLEIQGMAKKR